MPLLPSAAWQAAQILVAISFPLAISPFGCAAITEPAAKASANKVKRFMECS